MLVLSPKTRWNISRVLPFGIIYLVTTWVFTLVELSVYHSSVGNDYFVISVSFPMVLFVTISSFMVGVLIGVVEMIWLRNLFKDRPLFQKIAYKLAIYVVGGFLIIVVAFPIAGSIEFHLPPWHVQVVDIFQQFLKNISFYTSLLQMSFTVLLCLVYAAISENLGHAVLMNFFTGKYHQPTVEPRIFMFVDMKDSTALAEKLGHFRYFKFLRAYYDTFSRAIINHFGEVYQYVGDEIVISWPMTTGLSKANSVKCFFAMQKAMEKRKSQFLKYFGFCPRFKAGLHAGQVTTGEVGALKKEITFSGDVLNVTARLQGLCNQYQVPLLVSGSLLPLLPLEGQACHIQYLGKECLKGRKEPVELYTIDDQPAK